MKTLSLKGIDTSSLHLYVGLQRKYHLPEGDSRMPMQMKTFLFAMLLALFCMEVLHAQETELPPSGDEVVLGEEDLAERGEILRNMYR